MGLNGEFALIDELRGRGLRYEHRLRQGTIKQLLKKNNSLLAEACLEKNRSLPRERLSHELDIVAWGEGEYALAIEQKSQFQSVKTLCFGEQFTMHNGAIELRRSANDLLLQCFGAAYLAKAYMAAKRIDKKIIPVAVVDYDITLGGASANWAFHNGVFFVRTGYFPAFLDEFIKNSPWIEHMLNSCN